MCFQCKFVLLSSFLFPILCFLQQYTFLVWLILIFAFLPTTLAMNDKSPFPDMTFKVFSDFIIHNFSSKITLSTVLFLLFTMTENPELLNLHARQENPSSSSEKSTIKTLWMIALASSIHQKLGKDLKQLWKKNEINFSMDLLDFKDQNEEMAVDDEHSEINDDEMIANSVPTHASIKNDLVLNVLAPLS